MIAPNASTAPANQPRVVSSRASVSRLRGRPDTVLAIAIGLLTIGSRVPWMMHLPWAWDSVLYLRAMFLFNATIHQPQPPGYLFYVSLARLIDLLVHDDHRALVWVSILAAGLATSALYLVARFLYDRGTALLAAGFLATSVTFWFYSEIAYPYTMLAAGTTILAFVTVALRHGLLPGARGAVVAALAWALMAGFRQDLLLFLAPLFFAAMWGRPVRDWLAGCCAGAVGIVTWLVPTAALSEGFAKYLHATMRQGGLVSSSSLFALGFDGLSHNAQVLGIFLGKGIGFAFPGLLYFLFRTGLHPRLRNPALGWLVLWAGPPLLFYVLVHIGDYGYTFTILPALMVLAARGTMLAAHDLGRGISWVMIHVGTGQRFRSQLGRHVATVLLALVLLGGNSWLFVRHHSQLSATGITCFDQTMSARLRLVREWFRPDETLLFSSAYYQHVRYFLPEYPTWFWDPAKGSVSVREIDPGIRWLVVFDELAHPAPGQTAFQWMLLPCNGVRFYYARVYPGDRVRFDGRDLTLTLDR